MAWTVDLLADGAPRIGSGFGRNWRVDVQTVVGSSTYICKYLAGPVHRRKYLEYIERRARLAGIINIIIGYASFTSQMVETA